MMYKVASGAIPEFILLTGALGSGKTTLLLDYLASGDHADIGVIVNDAGEINVDGAVISSDNRDLSIASLGSGCICCSMGNSVQEGIDTLLAARADRGLGPMRRVILETSGLAEPSPILRSLRQVRQMDFRLRIVSTFNASVTNNDFLPQYASQLAAAQAIVVTKLDVTEKEMHKDRIASARLFNPFATIISDNSSIKRAKVAFESSDLPPLNPLSVFEASEAKSDRIVIAVARWKPGSLWGDIGDWIENVSGHFDSRLLRMKGVVHPKDMSTPVLVNGVNGALSSPRPIHLDDEDAQGLILILRDVDQKEFVSFARYDQAVEIAFK